MNLEAEINFNEILDKEKIKRIEQYATNLFGGEKKAYVELRREENNSYKLIVLTKEKQVIK